MEANKCSTRKRVSAEPLKLWLADNHLSLKEAADALGVSDAGVRGWVVSGEMPALAARALEGVKRRMSKPSEVYYVATCASGSIPAFESFCEAVGVALAKVKTLT